MYINLSSQKNMTEEMIRIWDLLHIFTWEERGISLPIGKQMTFRKDK